MSEHSCASDVEWKIAKITDTFLGFEDHGVFTLSVTLDYGGSFQGTPMFSYASHAETYPDSKLHEHLLGVLGAAGVDRWEKLRGRTIYALSGYTQVYALKPLPTEKGTEFWFRSEDKDKVDA